MPTSLRRSLSLLFVLLLAAAVPVAAAKTLSLQCSAITKTTKARCKRMVTVPEGTTTVLCWQHDPARKKTGAK